MFLRKGGLVGCGLVLRASFGCVRSDKLDKFLHILNIFSVFLFTWILYIPESFFDVWQRIFLWKVEHLLQIRVNMTRGNQRDLARAKNAKKDAKGKKADEMQGNKGVSLQDRKERDAQKMRDKQKKAADEPSSSK